MESTQENSSLNDRIDKFIKLGKASEGSLGIVRTPASSLVEKLQEAFTNYEVRTTASALVEKLQEAFTNYERKEQ